MAHKKLENGSVVVDWTTGDPEGDRKYLFQAYTDFLNELRSSIKHDTDPSEIELIFRKWNVSTDNQVDDFPRIWIKRPE